MRRAQDLLREARVERARQGICETIAPFDLRVGEDQECRAEIHSIDLGMVRIVYGSGGRLDGEVIRTPSLIRRSDPELSKIDLQLRGRAVVEQDDRQADLGRRGAFSFVDLSRPCQLIGGLAGVVAVMFPRSLLPLRYRDTRELAGVAFDPQEANSALVGALISQVTSRPAEYASPAGVRIGAAIFDLITAALSVRLDRVEVVPPDTQLRLLTWRVKSFIEERLGDPLLSPGQIAAAHHISLRYLYKIFEAQQTTVGSWIRSRRLDHCRRDLTDPALLARPVSAVGARWGFVDATHFARAFRTEYGATPSEYRRMWARPTPSAG
ncbi:MAG TPA: helix-turn-helix domain-containing protein [Pilimelia sp.]|nr:helix-turn-helix domain-containing protein [Pilimelia sp.]